MGSQKGQASVLIAIIFQIVFIFFAMVINVGLLVHDKINLQNSTDIAAYYGAMKQAEVFNAMAHVNYQIRQLWKLFNWRLWALADAGRNLDIQSYAKDGGGQLTDSPATWSAHDAQSSVVDMPVVCIRNPLWYDEVKLGKTGQQNLCQNVTLKLPDFKPVQLNPIQAMFPEQQLFAALSRQNVAKYNTDCNSSGPLNKEMAGIILQSYKIGVAKRRAAMQGLQKLLIESGSGRAQDFRDLSGNNVADTVRLTFLKNLTAANRASVQSMDFHNSLYQKPFLVPIEVRAFVKYLDLAGGTGPTKDEGCHATVKDVYLPPESNAGSSGFANMLEIANTFSGPDYFGKSNATAESFSAETNFQQWQSLVGFEKNPWVLAYVQVKATTTPRMLFAPSNGTVELKAESYAMPFGGRIGPWYSNTWPAGSPRSNGSDKIDALLPPRMGSGEGASIVTNVPPNYSRFPGDHLGMSSRIARAATLAPVFAGTGTDKPHFQDDDYGNLASDPFNTKQDPIVWSTQNPSPLIRQIETAAVSPDLFDAAYYSVQSNFFTFTQTNSGPYFDSQVCQYPKLDCLDLGVSRQASGKINESFSISDQIKQNSAAGAKVMPDAAFWFLRDGVALYSSWAQESTDNFLPPGGVPTRIGVPDAQGGRSGYSVKIVSRHFLERSDLPLGGSGSTGPISNSPATWGD